MKKIIFGGFLALAGALGAAILLAGTMASDMTLDGGYSAFFVLTQYRLMPALKAFLCLGIVGAATCLWGILDKKDR